MSFFKLIIDGFDSLNRGLEVISTELDELNSEHVRKEPFREVKRKAHEIKHIMDLSRIIVPETYTHSCKCLDVAIKIMARVIDLMNKAIDNPKKRAIILHVLDSVKKEMKSELSLLSAMMEKIMEEVYKHGLDRNAPIENKIRYILNQGTEEEIETIMLESLPKLEYAQQKVISAFSTIEKKGL